MKFLIRRYFLILFIAVCFCPYPVFAQCGTDPGGNPDLDPACPIDSGVVVLIIAALGITIKKYADSRKKIAVI